MLSPLKPLLCRHDFYWSERHRADRCRRCGKQRAADLLTDETPLDLKSVLSTGRDLIDSEGPTPRPTTREPGPCPPGPKVLKAQAQERCERLPEVLDRSIEGGPPPRAQPIDARPATIGHAHSAEARPSRGRTLLAMGRGMFCRHQWDTSRSRKGTYVCRACGARKV